MCILTRYKEGGVAGRGQGKVDRDTIKEGVWQGNVRERYIIKEWWGMGLLLAEKG